MAADRDRRWGFYLGLIAAVFLLLGALFHFALGIAFLVAGEAHSGVGSIVASVIDVGVAILIGLFAFVGRSPQGDRTLIAGIALLILALIGLLALGFGRDVFSVLAAIFALVGGVLFLVAGR